MARLDPASGAPPRKTQSRGQATREKLLRVARELFGQEGFEGTSIGDVARVAGVGVGTVYHHFADKRALLLELLDREIHATGIQLVDERGGPLARAFRGEDFEAGLVDGLRQVRSLRRGAPAVYLIALELVRRDPEVAQRHRALERRFVEATRSDIAVGQSLGRLRDDVDLDAAAFNVYHAFEAVMREIAAAEEPQAERLMAELARMIGRYLLAD